MFDNSPQMLSKSRQTAQIPRHPRPQASSQFMSNTSSNFKAMSSSTASIDKPDTAKNPSIQQNPMNIPRTTLMHPDEFAQSEIQSLSASTDLLSSEIARVNDSMRNMGVTSGRRFVSMDEQSASMDIPTSPKGEAQASDHYDIYQTQSPPKSKYAKKYIIENHVGSAFYSSSVIGGPLQRDEKEMLQLKKQEQQREMQLALKQQMEEKRQAREKELMQKRQYEQNEANFAPDEFNPSQSMGYDSEVFTPAKSTTRSEVPRSPAPSMPPQIPTDTQRTFEPPPPPRPRSLKALDSPGPSRYDSPAVSAPYYEPPYTVPETRDRNEECIDYLNVLCHSLMEKQQSLQDKVISQENEIKSLLASNQKMNSRVAERPRPIPKSATNAPSRKEPATTGPTRKVPLAPRKTPEERRKAIQEEQARKTKAIEDKIAQARMRAEARKWSGGRASVGHVNPPRAQTQQTRATNYTPKSLPPRATALTPNTVHPPAASISRATLPIFNFDPRENLDSAGTSQLIFPGESGLFTDELDKFLKSNNISQREERNFDMNKLYDPPASLMESSLSGEQTRKTKFPRDVFRVFRN